MPHCHPAVTASSTDSAGAARGVLSFGEWPEWPEEAQDTFRGAQREIGEDPKGYKARHFSAWPDYTIGPSGIQIRHMIREPPAGTACVPAWPDTIVALQLKRGYGFFENSLKIP